MGSSRKKSGTGAANETAARKAETTAAKPETIAVSPEPERLRQSAAPICPNCKNEQEKPYVVCVSQRSTPFATKYVCPNNCGFRLDVPRPNAQQRVQEAERRAAEPDFNARRRP